MTADFREIASGLKYPEGPIAMPDGSFVLVEIARGSLTRVGSDGVVEVIADLGGGPNGAAIGPDGHCYVCNNGGGDYYEEDGQVLFADGQSADWSGGRIERVDLDSGETEVLYENCDGHRFTGPNDIVFDAEGGFWFTDYGQTRKRERDLGGVYYAKPDGSLVKEAIYPVETPNGIGLSPDEKTLYVAESLTGRMFAFDVPEPGEVALNQEWPLGRLLASLPGLRMPDSLAVEADGTVSVANFTEGGITSISADGERIEHLSLPDPQTTNICFGGDNLQTAYVTLASHGKLIEIDWPRPGLALNFLNR